MKTQLIEFSNATIKIANIESIELDDQQVIIHITNNYYTENFDTEKQAITRKEQLVKDWLEFLTENL